MFFARRVPFVQTGVVKTGGHAFPPVLHRIAMVVTGSGQKKIETRRALRTLRRKTE